MYEDLDILRELQLCYPLWLLEFKEMKDIISASNKMLENAKNAVLRLVKNQLVSQADEYALSELEKFLGIKNDVQRGIKEQRDFISSQFVGNGVFGTSKIREIVSMFTKNPCNIRFSNGLDVDVEIIRGINDSFILDDCIEMLNKRKPAHIKLSVRLSTPFDVRAYYANTVSEYRLENII